VTVVRKAYGAYSRDALRWINSLMAPAGVGLVCPPALLPPVKGAWPRIGHRRICACAICGIRRDHRIRSSGGLRMQPPRCRGGWRFMRSRANPLF